jgi:molybdate transport system permease protein
MAMDILPVLGLTLKVATTATLLVVGPATWVGYALARWDFPGKRLLSALSGLPLVLPPTAVGFVLLRALAADGPLGREALGFDLGLLLTWRAAVLAAGVMSIPLVVRTARLAFEGVDPRLEAMARTLGHGPGETFVRVTLPLAGRGLMAATILGFTRALGEFGATVTFAGNLQGRTQTLPLAVFVALESDRGAAVAISLLMVLISLAVLVALRARWWRVL